MVPVNPKMTFGPTRETLRAALGLPSSPFGRHGVAQTPKVRILLKLLIISMGFWVPRGAPRIILCRAGGKPSSPYENIF